VTEKVTGQVAATRMDVWQIMGEADQPVVVKLQTRDDGMGLSSLAPALVFLESDSITVVADTTVRDVTCAVPTVCGAPCKQFKRTLTHNGLFHIAVGGSVVPGCGGGRYRLVVTKPGGTPPVLVADDVSAAGVIPGL
jgi:hypothetical protein